MILQLRCFTGKTSNISRANHKANRSLFNNNRKESRTRTRRSALMEAAPIRSSPFGLLEQSPPLLQPLLAVRALRQSVRRRVRSHLYLLRVYLSRALARSLADAPRPRPRLGSPLPLGGGTDEMDCAKGSCELPAIWSGFTPEPHTTKILDRIGLGFGSV